MIVASAKLLLLFYLLSDHVTHLFPEIILGLILEVVKVAACLDPRFVCLIPDYGHPPHIRIRFSNENVEDFVVLAALCCFVGI